MALQNDNRVDNKAVTGYLLRDSNGLEPPKWALANAYILTRWAIDAGVLKKQPCEVCRSVEVEAHHHDYAKPLEIRWFCSKHHVRYHVAMRNSGMAPLNRKYKTQPVPWTGPIQAPRLRGKRRAQR